MTRVHSMRLAHKPPRCSRSLVVLVGCFCSLVHIVAIGSATPTTGDTPKDIWSWTECPNMPESRVGHLAAVRPNGSVVIVGGVDPAAHGCTLNCRTGLSHDA